MVWWYLDLSIYNLPKALQFPEQDLDPTFIVASLLGLATFGVQTAKNQVTVLKMNVPNAAGGITKADLEKLIKTKSTGPVQTIRLSKHHLRLPQTTLTKM